jgi:hypothetical protein
MSDDVSLDYLRSREVDPELEADLARFREVRQRSQEQGFLEKLNADPLGNMPAPMRTLLTPPRNITVGVLDAAISAMGLAQDIEAGTKELGRKADPERQALSAQTTPHERRMATIAGGHDPVFDDLISATRELRGRLAKGSTTFDEITQSAAQFFVPFLGFSKLMGGLKAATAAGSAAKAATADAATMLTAFEPHEARFADLLRRLDTDNRLVNAYIDFVASDGDEGEWEGRLKNVLDSQIAAAGLYGVVKAGGVALKHSRKTLAAGAKKDKGNAADTE